MLLILSPRISPVKNKQNESRSTHLSLCCRGETPYLIFIHEVGKMSQQPFSMLMYGSIALRFHIIEIVIGLVGN